MSFESYHRKESADVGPCLIEKEEAFSAASLCFGLLSWRRLSMPEYQHYHQCEREYANPGCVSI